MRKISKRGVQGATFGVMEAAIMMLGVLLGLSVTQNKFIIVLGLLTAGIADAFANTASFYVSEESEMIHTKKESLKAAKMCFFGTSATVAAIVLPVILIKNTKNAVVLSLAIGLIILFFLGKYMAKKLKAKKPSKTITKYMAIGIVTAVICFLLGKFIEYAANGL